MATENARKTVAEIIEDPGQFYASPFDVVRDDELSRDDKLRVLGAMETDARELEVAEEENMQGGETSRLTDVLEAIRLLAPDKASAHALGERRNTKQ
ncbi:hypothetical protein [Oceanibacterium hippocampi]|uniref:Uncharacterized protein n=1 Tax=Oceanibacterium hippocampi TaxID=745714 RepID=A0A1Y5TF26_9PROT|nr:hypothetical protein [Oceanibacterium hippocampi]SLN62476.1 hypothetical protein OCH7691_02765 [Oceanibacterium hippocampi]